MTPHFLQCRDTFLPLVYSTTCHSSTLCTLHNVYHTSVHLVVYVRPPGASTWILKLIVLRAIFYPNSLFRSMRSNFQNNTKVYTHMYISIFYVSCEAQTHSPVRTDVLEQALYLICSGLGKPNAILSEVSTGRKQL